MGVPPPDYNHKGNEDAGLPLVLFMLQPLLFDAVQIVEIPPLDAEGRLQVLRIHTKKMSLAADVDLPLVARGSEGLSGAELAAVCREGALAALREDMGATHVHMRHFEAALEAIQGQ